MSSIRNHIDLTLRLRDHGKPEGAKHNLDPDFFGGACWCAMGVEAGSPDECADHGPEHVLIGQSAGHEGGVTRVCRICAEARIAKKMETAVALRAERGVPGPIIGPHILGPTELRGDEEVEILASDEWTALKVVEANRTTTSPCDPTVVEYRDKPTPIGDVPHDAIRLVMRSDGQPREFPSQKRVAAAIDRGRAKAALAAAAPQHPKTDPWFRRESA